MLSTRRFKTNFFNLCVSTSLFDNSSIQIDPPIAISSNAEDSISSAFGIELVLDIESISLRSVQTIIVPNPLASRNEIMVPIHSVIELVNIDSVGIVGIYNI